MSLLSRLSNHARTETQIWALWGVVIFALVSFLLVDVDWTRTVSQSIEIIRFQLNPRTWVNFVSYLIK